MLVLICSEPQHSPEKAWLESRWSEETWTGTDTDGTSAVCFCMAVRCGYIKQVRKYMFMIIIIIISVLLSSLLWHRPSLWITHKEDGP
jgi:hypothetical protein